MEATESVRFQLVDRSGLTLPLAPTSVSTAPGSLKLQTGYPQGMASPKLQAVASDKVIAETDVPSIPPPPRVTLAAHADPRLKLYLRNMGRNQYWIETAAEPRLTENERWRIVARRASFAPRLVDVSAVLPPRMGRRPSNVLFVPFPEQAAAVEVEVTKYRMQERSCVVDIPNIRLVNRFGGTGIVVDRDVTIRTPIGAILKIPSQYMGPRRQLRTRDPRSASVSVGVEIDNAPPPPELGMGSRATSPTARMEILGIDPTFYGLRELRVGSAGIRSSQILLPSPRLGHIPVRLRLTIARPIPKGRSVSVLPVETSKHPFPVIAYPSTYPSYFPRPGVY